MKLFISHGGLIGTQEATFHGVPIVGVPIYADQYNNLLQIQEHGYGKLIEYHNINEESLFKIVHEVITNDSYKKKAKEMSVRFRDRPMSPLDTAMFWIEYVIRYNGAEHLKNPARNMSWVAYSMIDVYAFIVIVVLLSLYTILKVPMLLLSLIKLKQAKKQKKKRS